MRSSRRGGGPWHRLPQQKQHGPQRRPAPSCSHVAVRLPDEEERRQQEKHDVDFVSLCLQGVRRNSKKTDRELLYQEHVFVGVMSKDLNCIYMSFIVQDSRFSVIICGFAPSGVL